MNQQLNELWKLIYEELKNFIPVPDSSISLWFGDIELKYISENRTMYFSVYYYLKKDFIEKHYMSAFCKAIERVVGFEPIPVIISTEKDTFENQFAELVSTETDEMKDSAKGVAAEEETVPKDDLTLMRSVFPPEKEIQKRGEPSNLNEAIHGGIYAPKKFNTESGSLVETPLSRVIDDTSSGSLMMSKSVPTSYPSYTFENFVVGSTNRFAYQFSLIVSQYPGQAHNPLFIYGDPGLGKTHLLYAITNEIQRLHPTMNILYVKSDDFTNELVEAIQKRTPVQFRDKYRSCDVLLIDDIQFIAGKESSQEEFLHTYNALYETGKQIIVASDRPPKEMNGLVERLKSRFESGVITKIDPPELELRTAIIKKKFEFMNIDIPNEVIMFLAENIKDNIRQIEGVIKKLNVFCKMNNEKITLELAQKSISDIVDLTPVFDHKKIISAVAEKYGISVELILGRRKTGEIVKARHYAIHMVRQLIPELSITEIARIFNRDHTTIMAALQKMDTELLESPITKNEIAELISFIKSKF